MHFLLVFSPSLGSQTGLQERLQQIQSVLARTPLTARLLLPGAAVNRVRRLVNRLYECTISVCLRKNFNQRTSQRMLRRLPMLSGRPSGIRLSSSILRLAGSGSGLEQLNRDHQLVITRSTQFAERFLVNGARRTSELLSQPHPLKSNYFRFFFKSILILQFKPNAASNSSRTPLT